MYAKAERGETPNFPGVSAPYDVPAAADLVVDTARTSVEDCVGAIVRLIESRAWPSARDSAPNTQRDPNRGTAACQEQSPGQRSCRRPVSNS